MSGILSIAVSGLNNAAANFAQATSNIVNASSTGGGGTQAITSGLVALQTDKTAYAADAAVVKTTQKIDNTLLNILA